MKDGSKLISKNEKMSKPLYTQCVICLLIFPGFGSYSLFYWVANTNILRLHVCYHTHAYIGFLNHSLNKTSRVIIVHLNKLRRLQTYRLF